MSDEVSQFLEQVERLRGQQIEEDEVRAKELEDYMAAKRERQARREERARSISPQKSSPANTPSPRSNRRSVLLSEGLRLESPGATKDDEDNNNNNEPSGAQASAEPEGKQEAMSYPLSSPTKENESPENDTKPTPRPPSRGSALSWQQRPKSRNGGRPLSMLATQNATQRSLVGSQEPTPASASEQVLTKDQIAQSLGSKDPSWFRQTADRGANSAAYRRNQVEDDDRLDMSSIKAQLPGMTADKPKTSPPIEPTASTPTKQRLASPPTLNPPRFEHPGEDRSSGERSVTPTGRTSPIRSNSRSNSPTKGMGGFVQSAMMKRSDSVKRWSVTSPPGLARADSVTSNRGVGSFSTPTRTQTASRPGSKTPSSSRPTSRHGEDEPETETTPKAPTIDTSTPKTEDKSLPVSPSKTMDPRRWSPTKSSWLESALNKPDSPKPQHKPTSSQPAWMAELNKNKAEKVGSASAETGRPRPGSISHKHQVSIGGLMRSTAVGDVAKPNTTGLGGIYSPPPGGNRPAFGYGGLNLAKTSPKLEQKGDEDKPADPVPEPEAEPQPAEETKPQEPERVTSPPAGSPAIKPKPEAPPKKDFRGSLRHRPAEADASQGKEPEFKAVFGTLRRTKTQNYVAPDELKGNILRGKAALNVTGGPQKTERVDEFKEAILKKKDDFQKAQSEGKGITRTPTVSSNQVPEGIARRAEMSKKRESVLESKLPTASAKSSSPKPVPGPKRIPSHSSLTPKSPPSAESSPTVPAAPRALPGLQGRIGTSKLADRFNPGLAGLLAKGPPPMATNGGQKEDSGSQGATGSSTPATEPTAPGPQLTHMTKGRARGPRRKAPTTAGATTAATDSPAAESKPDPTPSAPVEVKEEAPEEKPALAEKVEEAKPATFSIQQQVAAKAALRGKPTPPKQPAQEVSSTPERPFSLQRRQTVPEPTGEEYPSPLKVQKTGDPASRPGSPRKLDSNRMSRFMAEPDSTKEPARLTHQRTGSRSPVKMFQRSLPEPEPSTPKFEKRSLPGSGSSSPTRRPLPEPQPSSPTKVDSDPVASVKSGATFFSGAAVRTPPSATRSSFDGPGAQLEVSKTPSRVASRPLPVPVAKEEQSAQEEQPAPAVASPPPKQGNDVASLFSDFFGPKQSRTSSLNVDTADILSKRPSEGAKVQPLSFQTFQISGEGKKTPVSSHFERVLFEQEMYICPHSFTNEAGWKRLEVYFWIGDEVSEASAEDALVFVQNEVKALGAKLVKIQQGKETAEFLQAMGGVIIVRRGSSKKFDSLAPNMLCGRRFLGQVAFDEVDLTTPNLCSGFPYLVSQGGKCYLWKGKGSDVAELSCARLIGMELSLTGELVEYDDGNEPASFWELFEGGSKPGSADHWRLKPNYAKYSSRLFCSDANTRQQIFEVAPFNQRDVSPEHIYVLDAFFEMYIVVGSRAQDQYDSFRNALDFAQEYAILASGMEDRPFVPISTVVLEGIPRDLKRVFRNWRDEYAPTATTTPAASTGGALKRGRSLRVVSLTQALQALSE